MGRSVRAGRPGRRARERCRHGRRARGARWPASRSFARLVPGGGRRFVPRYGRSDEPRSFPPTSLATAFAMRSIGHHVSMNSPPEAFRPSTHQPTWRPRRTVTSREPIPRLYPHGPVWNGPRVHRLGSRSSGADCGITRFGPQAVAHHAGLQPPVLLARRNREILERFFLSSTPFTPTDAEHMVQCELAGCVHPAIFYDDGEPETAQGWCDLCRQVAHQQEEALMTLGARRRRLRKAKALWHAILGRVQGVPHIAPSPRPITARVAGHTPPAPRQRRPCAGGVPARGLACGPPEFDARSSVGCMDTRTAGFGRHGCCCQAKLAAARALSYSAPLRSRSARRVPRLTA